MTTFNLRDQIRPEKGSELFSTALPEAKTTSRRHTHGYRTTRTAESTRESTDGPVGRRDAQARQKTKRNSLAGSRTQVTCGETDDVFHLA